MSSIQKVLKNGDLYYYLKHFKPTSGLNKSCNYWLEIFHGSTVFDFGLS